MNEDSGYLLQFETTDPVLIRVKDNILEMIRDLGAEIATMGIRFCIVDFDEVKKATGASPFYTDNMVSLLQERLIIANVRFITELEAAIHALSISESVFDIPYFRNDDYLASCISEIADDPKRYVDRARHLFDTRYIRDISEDDPAAILTLTVFYFVAHEIGHLADECDGRNFGTFFSENNVLEQRIEHAVVKMCTHADEFKKYGFDLPGLAKTEDGRSSIRKKEREFKKGLGVAEANNQKWFKDEVRADKTADKILIYHIREALKKDPFDGNLLQYHLVKGLFTAGIYFWYKDQNTFYRKFDGIHNTNSAMLGLIMMQDREKYINAASLFGERHRFILLRSVLAIGEVLKETTDYFAKVKIWGSTFFGRYPETENDIIDWRLSEMAKMNFLLSMIMDTAVKMAYVGCSTGWIKEQDAKRGIPQLLSVQFESIDQAIRRIKKLTNS
ncbi:MAG: hypothetical protein JWQ38_1753 [Flavipsychrobacter sp.]|nr:hypothetical protein [Flavipsychrobacter sp.]